MAPTPKGYYSSEQKDVLRDRFDRPLIEAHASTLQRRLRYFGLPGGDARDVECWKSSIQYVSAVDKRKDELSLFENVVAMRFPEISYTTHWGDLDGVILKNYGKVRNIGGQTYRPAVGTRWEDEVDFRVWDFDLLNLDYFGPFLPANFPGVENKIHMRANALGMLFNKQRQDAWQPWLLLITVESSMASPQHRAAARAYVQGAAHDASGGVQAAVAAALAAPPNTAAESALLIHATAGSFVAECATAANLDVISRGTVLYLGAGDQPMIHMAYELTPAALPLHPPLRRLELLTAPILIVRRTLDEPWIDLAPNQLSDLNYDHCTSCLDFLGQEAVKRILERVAQ